MKGLDRGRFVVLAGLTCAVGAAGPVLGQVDSLETFISQGDATGGTGRILSGFAYDPATDTAYTTTSGSFQSMRRIDDVTAAPDGSMLVGPTQWQYWLRDGVTSRGGGQPAAGGIILNPTAVGSIGPREAAYIIDLNAPITNDPIVDGNNTRRNELTRRLYRWNLQPALPDSDPAAAGSVLTSLVTKADTAAAIGLANPNTTTLGDSVLKQPAFGNDGKSVYFIDILTNFGGLWRADVTTGAVERLVAETATGSGVTRLGAEPAVRAVSASTDRIYINGSTTHGNAGGLNYVEYNHQADTVGPMQSVLSLDAIKTFMDTTGSIGINTISTDAAGNVYLDVSGGSALDGTRRSAVLRLDEQGRLAKVVSYAERETFFENAQITATKHQHVTGTYAGPNGPRQVGRLLFADTSSSGAYVGAVWLFEPGDFNRDGLVNAADASLLTVPGVLSPRGVTTTDVGRFKFDLNADLVANTGAAQQSVAVDYRDVKVFQQFYDFEDGDANIDLAVDYTDLNLARDNYLGTDKVWTQGDFTGDNLVDLSDLEVLADTWLLTLAQPTPTFADLDFHGYTGQFRADVITAFAIPEPSALALLSLGALALGRRRRK